MKRIVLEYEDFEKLIAGEIVLKDEVKIILSDIGWHNMITIVANNQKKST